MKSVTPSTSSSSFTSEQPPLFTVPTKTQTSGVMFWQVHCAPLEEQSCLGFSAQKPVDGQVGLATVQSCGDRLQLPMMEPFGFAGSTATWCAPMQSPSQA